MHFFNPVARMQLVEVVHGEQTAAEQISRGASFARRIDKLPVPVKSYPGFLVNRVLMPYLLEAMIDAPIRGLALETFGSGNIPNTPGLIEVIERAAVQRGLLTVAITQQRQGIVQLHTYAAGRRLLDAGVVSGYDMTPHTALVKLMFLIAQKDTPPAVIRQQLTSNLRGELTKRNTIIL